MKAYLAPTLAFAAAITGTLGDTRDQHGLTPVGWISVVVALASVLATYWTITQQRSQIRLRTEAWKRSLQAAVSHNMRVISYLNFAARQFALQVAQLGTSQMTGTNADFAHGMPNGWSDELPPRDALGSDREIGYLKEYRVDPPRGIGGPWSNPVPFGTDRRKLPVLVSQETALGLERLRQVQDLYGNLLDGGIVNLISQLVENPFAEYLQRLPEFCAMRAEMEDSRWPDVRLVGGQGAPSLESYREWLAALDALSNLASDTLGTRRSAASDNRP